MRRVLLLVWAPLALALACTSSDDEPSRPPLSPNADGSTLSDGSTVEAAAHPQVPDTGADVEPPATCSPAGWCITTLPDLDLSMKDIWPLPNAAFAIAESPTLGVKVLAWNKTSNAWSYIDDNTQNEPGYGKYAGGIWAASESDVYYTVAPGAVYHGSRSDPSAPWSWVRYALDDHSPDDPHAPGALPHDHGNPMNRALEGNFPALGVWGTSSTDVYAWYANTIFHWSQDGSGNPAWIAEYTADDVDSDPDYPDFVEHMYIVSATGTGPDNVLFSGTRDGYPDGTACALLVQKTPDAGYQRIADGVVPGPSGKDFGCAERRGVLMIGGSEGWLTDIHALAPDRILGLKGGRDVVQLTADRGGGYAVSGSSFVPISVTSFKSGLSSFWSMTDGSEDQTWLSGFGLVLRGADIWGKEPEYQISTIALNGAPTRRPIYRVRGTSSDDLWAVGVRYAFHKTTP